jgi:hypothetical protein
MKMRKSEKRHQQESKVTIGIRRGVSKRVENGRRPPTIWVGYPRNSHLGVAYPQGLERSGMARPGETLMATPSHTPMKVTKKTCEIMQCTRQ